MCEVQAGETNKASLHISKIILKIRPKWLEVKMRPKIQSFFTRTASFNELIVDCKFLSGRDVSGFYINAVPVGNEVGANIWMITVRF
jgi:hypothetical protein